MSQALLIIDVQRGLFDPAPRPFEADAVVDRINLLSAQARAARVPVVFVQHERPEGSLVHGTESWQLEERLVVDAEDEVIRKRTPDSFLRTGLQDLLTQWGVTDLVICGYASEFCVDTTVRRAAALGYPVLLAADAHTTHDKEHASAAQIRAHHNATLSNIVSFGPRIVAKNSADIAFG
ncbi:cysteine hydrolase family protein [Geothrix sp. PMB-07]|uniref:cysteine hydrolase family protein n=1 Tax=Geothrix sp. PMB-07 TaxID=3068640 RepID=UPI0027408E7F|nr:cysteine hydrolase family protein [Geothrix sp. PMB-07]WLT32972.1 cysteine hydrolase family protein [Geothrix sp. PMB-07]